jgi:CRP-like cAMP-binding protein
MKGNSMIEALVSSYSYIPPDARLLIAFRKLSIPNDDGGCTPRDMQKLYSNARSLRNINAFRNLSDTVLDRIRRCCHWRRYPAKSTIVQYGDDRADVFLLINGDVRMTYYSECGREVTVANHTKGDIFGALGGIMVQRPTASMFAVTETLVAIMTAAQFQYILQENGQIAIAVLAELGRMICALEKRVIEFSTLSVEKRIYAELLRLAGKGVLNENGAIIVPAPTHAEIASRISTHREAVTRTLNRLEKKRVLTKQRGTLIFQDVSALNSMIQDEMTAGRSL